MKKVLLWIGAVLVAVPVVVLIGAVVFMNVIVWTNHASAIRRLHAADPKELLAACRIVMTNYPSYRPNRDVSTDNPHPDPTDPKMPETIRKLQPTAVILYLEQFGGDGNVRVYMGRDAIVTVLPDGKALEGRPPGKKILEGLYYFECSGGN